MLRNGVSNTPPALSAGVPVTGGSPAIQGESFSSRYGFEGFVLELEERRLWREGQEISLRPKAFDLLCFLVLHPGHLCSKRELLDSVWHETAATEGVLAHTIQEVRQALADDAHSPRYILTVPKTGYRFVAEVDALECGAGVDGGGSFPGCPGDPGSTTEPHHSREIPADAGRAYWVKAKWGKLVVAAASILGLTLLGALAIVRLTEGPGRETSTVRSLISLEPGCYLGSGGLLDRPAATALAQSPDGSYLVFTSTSGKAGSTSLYFRALAELETRPLAGTAGAEAPFISPDGRQVGFWAGGRLKKVRLEDGVVMDLCPAAGVFGATWGTDETIVFSPTRSSGLYRVASEGGDVEVLTVPDASRQEWSHRLPHWLPGGKGVLFTIFRSHFDAHPEVAVLDEGLGQYRVLLADASDARYRPGGPLLFVRRGTLMAVQFDPVTLQVTGSPTAVLEGVMQSLNVPQPGRNTGAGQYSVSDPGTLVYAAGGIFPRLELSFLWRSPNGEDQPVPGIAGPFLSPRLSPDGRWLAAVSFGGDRRMWIFELLGKRRQQLALEGLHSAPAWERNGDRLSFSRAFEGSFELAIQNLDGSSRPELFPGSGLDRWASSWSPDGTLLAFVQENPGGNGDIFFFRTTDHLVLPFLGTTNDERFPEFSPDGKWLAYQSDGDSDNHPPEVFVRAVDGSGLARAISVGGGLQPVWAPAQDRLFYRWAGQLWAVEVHPDRDGQGLRFSQPRALVSEPEGLSQLPGRNYDIAPDGQAFLMLDAGSLRPEPVSSLVLVAGWESELRRLQDQASAVRKAK